MLYKLAQKLSLRGIIIKISFINNGIAIFRTVCNSKHADLFGLKGSDSEFTDIITEQPVEFDENSVTCLEYLYVPKHIFLDDFEKNTEYTNLFGEDFLIKSKHYIETTTKKIQEERARFIMYSSEQLEPCNRFSNDLLDDYYYMKFYPEKRDNISREIVYDKIKEDIIKKYFLIKDSDNRKIKGAFRRLGITNAAEQINDPDYINAFKNIWYSLIEEQKEEQLLQLDTAKQNILKAEGVDKEDFLQQCDILELMIKQIDKTVLLGCNSISEIIKTWPSYLQPEPYYIDNE